MKEVAGEAEAAGLATHWGRKVLELRPPVRFDKGLAVRDLVEPLDRARRAVRRRRRHRPRRLRRARRRWSTRARSTSAVRVGVRSDEGPAAIVERADVVVDGVEGFAAVLAALADP